MIYQQLRSMVILRMSYLTIYKNMHLMVLTRNMIE
nr:MAG TPA: hypothetical protein [Bacteriophage sp.]